MGGETWADLRAHHSMCITCGQKEALSASFLSLSNRRTRKEDERDCISALCPSSDKNSCDIMNDKEKQFTEALGQIIKTESLIYTWKIRDFGNNSWSKYRCAYGSWVSVCNHFCGV